MDSCRQDAVTPNSWPFVVKRCTDFVRGEVVQTVNGPNTKLQQPEKLQFAPMRVRRLEVLEFRDATVLGTSVQILPCAIEASEHVGGSSVGDTEHVCRRNVCE